MLSVQRSAAPTRAKCRGGTQAQQRRLHNFLLSCLLDARTAYFRMEFFAQERSTPPIAAVRYRVLVRRPGAIGQTETLYRELRETRVTLFTREGYY